MSNMSTTTLAVSAALAGLIFGPSPAHAAEPREITVHHPTYSEVIGHLNKAAVPLRELGTQGKVSVTLAAGRVVAMAFSAHGENLLWSNPQLADADLVKNHPEKLVGGMGGDRLWFAPELDYHWDGKPDWASFANYKPPAAADPGAYAFANADGQSIVLRAKGELPVHGANRRVGFEVERAIRLAKSPLAASDPLMKGIDYVGIEASHRLQIAEGTQEGVIDLWHLLQIPVGSTLVVPLKKDIDAKTAKPLSYGLPGGWVEKSDQIRWRYGGEAKAKLGLPAAALTGRTAVIRPLNDGRWCLLVRDFSVDPKTRYADHLYGLPRTDQAFQAWDGYGFGEMEFHSPALDAKQGPRQLTESDRLWAFGGSPAALAAIAHELLGVDVLDIMTRGAQSK